MSAAKNRRHDCHRPGAIIPAHYSHIKSFNLASSEDGWPVPSWGINCELDFRIVDEKGNLVRNGEHRPDGKCCVMRINQTMAKAQTGRRHGAGKCTVCGAAFVYGDVWVHEPTGEVIYIGHDCADKYELLADRSAWELQLGRLRQAAAVEGLKAMRAEEREAFLAKHEGLAEDLTVEHPIIADIASRFREHRSLSDKQIALVRKLADEVRNPKPAEANVPAPTGKVVFTGQIVSVKSYESYYGLQLKCTVKVTTDAGVWLAWGTLPAQIFDAQSNAVRCSAGVSSPSEWPDLRGAMVEISATLKRGRDAHFALMSRPRGKVLAWAPEEAAKIARVKAERSAEVA
jgi:hypothetical protein